MPELPILFNDNHFLAVAKPVGMLTQPAPDGHGLSAEELAKEWIKREQNKPGNVYLHAVHRLDREVSGIVLFARTSKALARMNALVRDRQVVKTYLALVSPSPTIDDGELRHWLDHGDHRAGVHRRERSGTKEAVLQFREIQRIGNRSRLEITLQTGRYHQIRAQLAAAGMPILGDTRYDGRGTVTPGIFLHHYRMTFAHPVGGEPVVIEAPLPEAWRTGLQCDPAPPSRGGRRASQTSNRRQPPKTQKKPAASATQAPTRTAARPGAKPTARPPKTRVAPKTPRSAPAGRQPRRAPR